MQIKRKTLSSLDQLSSQIKSKVPTIFIGARTSMVLPHEKMESYLLEETQFRGEVCDLNLPQNLELSAGLLKVTGQISWREARAYCRANGRDIMTAPTEELASILSGVATSATGERCFGFGTLRDQIHSITFMNHKGELVTLEANRPVSEHELFSSSQNLIDEYQNAYAPYKSFKNGPYPKIETQCDLQIGFEGQLGVITEVVLKTTEFISLTYIFLSLPKWEDDYSLHLKLFNKVQGIRDKVFACELIDSNSLGFLTSVKSPIPEERDLIYLEIAADQFDSVYEQILSEFTELGDEHIFEMPAAKCHELRMTIPRDIFEQNTKMGVLKKGTDVQVRPERFKDLLDYYRSWTQKGVGYNLFGHFGDAHLHFNFMPTTDQVDDCQQTLEDFYFQVRDDLNGSPFAEHGVGLIKQKFIRPYYGETQRNMFKLLKSYFDPENQFFPIGFMQL